MEKLECRENLALVVLPCSRCIHAKKIEDIDDEYHICCTFNDFQTTLEEAVCIARICPYFSQSIDTLSKIIKEKSS
ncbi:hypothetical protein [Candidatus Harpocratesius sp.]